MTKQQAIDALRTAYEKGCAVIDKQEAQEWLKDVMKAALAAQCRAQAEVILSRPSDSASGVTNARKQP